MFKFYGKRIFYLSYPVQWALHLSHPISTPSSLPSLFPPSSENSSAWFSFLSKWSAAYSLEKYPIICTVSSLILSTSLVDVYNYRPFYPQPLLSLLTIAPGIFYQTITANFSHIWWDSGIGWHFSYLLGTLSSIGHTDCGIYCWKYCWGSSPVSDK